jgi:hypothetical protein
MGDGETKKMGEAVNKEDEQGAVGPARQFGRASAPQPAVAAALGLGERAYMGLQCTREVGQGVQWASGARRAGQARWWAAGEERRVGRAGEAGRKEGRWPSGPLGSCAGRPTRTEGRRPDW